MDRNWQYTLGGILVATTEGNSTSRFMCFKDLALHTSATQNKQSKNLMTKVSFNDGRTLIETTSSSFKTSLPKDLIGKLRKCSSFSVEQVKEALIKD